MSQPPATVRTMPRWSSPPEMTTPVSPAIFCIPPIQFAHPQWNSAFCGDPRQAEVSRREMMAWGQAIMLNGSPGILPEPSCGWLEKDKQGDYRWREAGKQAADKGTVMNNAQACWFWRHRSAGRLGGAGAAAPRLAGSGAGQGSFLRRGRCAGRRGEPSWSWVPLEDRAAMRGRRWPGSTASSASSPVRREGR